MKGYKLLTANIDFTEFSSLVTIKNQTIKYEPYKINQATINGDVIGPIFFFTYLPLLTFPTPMMHKKTNYSVWEIQVLNPRQIEKCLGSFRSWDEIKKFWEVGGEDFYFKLKPFYGTMVADYFIPLEEIVRFVFEDGSYKIIKLKEVCDD